MATIYDIAKAAGVTATTVSYVLSGKGSISEATREKILKIAQELGYRPNLIARSLSKQNTSTLGLVLPNVDNPFYAEVVETIERKAYAAGFRVFVTNTYRDERLGQELLDDLMFRRVDGIIAVSEGLSVEAIETMQQSGFPIVCCIWGEREQKIRPTIAFDFKMAGCLAGEHLLMLGHRQVGIITDGITEGGIVTKIKHSMRVDGCEEVYANAGFPLDRALLRTATSSIESGKEAALELLALREPPTAIFATNDLMAIGVMAAAWELGIQIPRQLSVVGFDDIFLSAYTTPPLTTVVMRGSAVAEQAMRLLFDMIEGKPVSAAPILQPQLVVRASTAQPYSG